MELENDYKKLKMKYEQMQSWDDIEALKQKLQDEYYWSEVGELEHEANMVQEKYDKQKAKNDELAEKLRRMEQNFSSNNSTIRYVYLCMSHLQFDGINNSLKKIKRHAFYKKPN